MTTLRQMLGTQSGAVTTGHFQRQPVETMPCFLAQMSSQHLRPEDASSSNREMVHCSGRSLQDLCQLSLGAEPPVLRGEKPLSTTDFALSGEVHLHQWLGLLGPTFVLQSKNDAARNHIHSIAFLLSPIHFHRQ